MCSSLAPGKSSTPPAHCIHRPQRDTSSAEYRLLVSRASVGASRELSSRRSPAFAPHICAVSPTFRYGAFFFVALALADLSSARLPSCARNHTSLHLNRLLEEAMRRDSRMSPLMRPPTRNINSPFLIPNIPRKSSPSISFPCHHTLDMA